MVLVMGGEGRMRPGLELEQQGKKRVGGGRSRPWFLFLLHPDQTSDPECLALGDIALALLSTPPPHTAPLVGWAGLCALPLTFPNPHHLLQP